MQDELTICAYLNISAKRTLELLLKQHQICHINSAVKLNHFIPVCLLTANNKMEPELKKIIREFKIGFVKTDPDFHTPTFDSKSKLFDIYV